MTTQPTSPIDVVTAFLHAMEQKDYDTGLQYVADDCVYVNGPTGTMHGPGGVRAALEPFFAPVLENVFAIKRQVASGATVFIERLDRHRLPNGWVELPVTGVFEVHDGRINVWNEYFDLATLMNAMAELPK